MDVGISFVECRWSDAVGQYYRRIKQLVKPLFVHVFCYFFGRMKMDGAKIF